MSFPWVGGWGGEAPFSSSAVSLMTPRPPFPPLRIWCGGLKPYYTTCGEKVFYLGAKMGMAVFLLGNLPGGRGGLFRSRKLFLAHVLTIIGRVVFSGGKTFVLFPFAVQMGGRGLRKRRFQRNCLFRPPPTRCRGGRDIISWLRTRTSRRKKGGGKEINVSGERGGG